MSTRVYRCTTDKLNIRTEPRSGADRVGTIRFNERINVQTATRTAADGFLWVRHDAGWSAERSLNGVNVYLTDNLNGLNRAKIWGINIDPDNPQATGNVNALRNVGWVRMVFHVESRGRTLAQSLSFYNNIVNEYVRNGVQVLFILLQDTYAGNAPWVTDNSANGWRTYTAGFTMRAREIARYFKGRIAAYQIWNEGDVSGQPTSIFIAPEFYAGLLADSAQGIGLQDPQAQVISTGLAAGTDTSLNYLRQVRTACGGILPCDGIGLHPYGQIPDVPDAEPFPGWSTGSLQNTLIRFSEEFPGHPIYITEIGVPRIQDLNDQNIWARIASYMQKTAEYIRLSFPQSVAAVVWFAWSDSMDRAGITNFDQQPKGVLYNQFFTTTEADKPKLGTTRSVFGNRVGLFHLSSDTLRDGSVAEYARRLSLAAPNVRDLILYSSRGTTFAGVGASNPALAIRNESDLWWWALVFAYYRMDIHLWHKIAATTPGQITSEIAFLQNLLPQTYFARSIIIDVERTMRLTSANVRDYMISLRRILPAGMQIGVTFDPISETIQNNAIADFAPFVQAWLPRLPVTTNTQMFDFLQAAVNARQGVNVPVIPVLQPGGPQANLPKIQEVARLAFDNFNCPAVMYHRAQDFSDAEWLTIRSVGIPYNAGTRPVS